MKVYERNEVKNYEATIILKRNGYYYLFLYLMLYLHYLHLLPWINCIVIMSIIFVKCADQRIYLSKKTEGLILGQSVKYTFMS